MSSDPFGKYSGLTEAIAAMLRAEDAADIYGHVHRFLDRCLNVVCLKVVECREGAAASEAIWASASPPSSAGLFAIPLEAQADFRAFPSARVFPTDEEAFKRTGARSLILASIETPEGDVKHKLLLWVADADADNDPRLLMVLRVITSLAAQVLSIHAARRASAQEQALLREMIESVPQAILAVSPEGRLLACNRNAEFLCRFRRGDWIGKMYQEALPAAVAGAISALMLASSRGGDKYDEEFDLVLDSHTRLRMGISLDPMLDQESRPTGFVFILRDLALRGEAQRLRQLHQMNLDFIHTVSHEIKAPLTSILLGAGDLLGQADELGSDRLPTVQLIDESARRIQDLVNDLLDVAKMESGHSELEPEAADLGATVRKLADSYQRLQRANLQLEIEAPLPLFKFDPKKIYRAIENLVVNAIKYSPGASMVRVRVTRQEDFVKVAVADEGIGIPADRLPLVWEKFYRGYMPNVAHVPGSGLGLTIVKHIVQMHGGAVEATSEVGKGSVFAFTLPLQGAAKRCAQTS